MPEPHSTRGCRRVGGGRRTREAAQRGYSETLGGGERSLRARAPARRHRRQRNKMVVGKAEGWALCRRKPRYSVCLLTGRAKSPPLSCPVHAGAPRATQRAGGERRGGRRCAGAVWRQARRMRGLWTSHRGRPSVPWRALPVSAARSASAGIYWCVQRGCPSQEPASRTSPAFEPQGPRRPMTPSGGDGKPTRPCPVTSREGDSRFPRTWRASGCRAVATGAFPSPAVPARERPQLSPGAGNRRGPRWRRPSACSEMGWAAFPPQVLPRVPLILLTFPSDSFPRSPHILLTFSSYCPRVPLSYPPRPPHVPLTSPSPPPHVPLTFLLMFPSRSSSCSLQVAIISPSHPPQVSFMFPHVPLMSPSCPSHIPIMFLITLPPCSPHVAITFLSRSPHTPSPWSSGGLSHVGVLEFDFMTSPYQPLG